MWRVYPPTPGNSGTHAKPDVDPSRGCPRRFPLSKDYVTKPPLDSRHGHGNLRLHAADVCPYRHPYSPATGLPIEAQTVSQMVDRVMEMTDGTRLYLLAPIVRGRKGEYRRELQELSKKGFQRVKVDGEHYEIDEAPGSRKLKTRYRSGRRSASGARRPRTAPR